MIFLADLSDPITPSAKEFAEERPDLDGRAIGVVTEDTPGFMLVTQTCDIVRPADARPFVEICPLVAVPSNRLASIKAGKMPRYVYAHAVSGVEYAADLDRITTIEKPLLAGISPTRSAANATPDQRKQLSSALARKRARTAFPDDFNRFIEPLQKRIVSKHAKGSPEGLFLDWMYEIRVRPDPDWTADSITVWLFAIFRTGSELTPDADEQLETLLSRVEPSDKFVLEGRIVTLESFSAANYLGSDPLDLDALSYS